MNDQNQPLVFNRAAMRQHRNRAAAGFTAHDVLLTETADSLIERLGDVKRDFPTVLDLGAHHGALTQRLAEMPNRFIVASDISEPMVKNASSPAIVADEEFLPFAQNSFDLIISNLSLHWVNDLPGALVQINQTLKPDGLFLGAVFGGQTLCELRSCLLDAELSVTGGISPRLSPTIELQASSGLLQRAGFVLPVADQETITLTYRDAFALMRDLRGMGETNAHLHRLKHATRRTVLFETARLYQERFAEPDGRIAATFDIIFLHGWKAPHA